MYLTFLEVITSFEFSEKKSRASKNRLPILIDSPLSEFEPLTN